MRPSPFLLRLLGLTLGLLMIPLAAAAQDDGEEGKKNDWSRTGPYFGASVVGGGFTAATDDLNDQLSPLGLELPPDFSAVPPFMGTSNDIEHDLGLGYDIYVGYRAHKFVAAELEFEHLTDIEFDENGGTFLDGESMTFTASVRAILPLGRFEPFGVVGVGLMHTDLNDSQNLGVVYEDGVGFLWKVGGGFDFHVTECVGLRFSTDYMRPKGNIHNLEHVSVGGGLFYHF